MLSACNDANIDLVKELLRKGAPVNFSNQVMKHRYMEMKLPNAFQPKAYTQGIKLFIRPLLVLAAMIVAG